MYQGFISTECNLVFLAICLTEAFASKGYRIGDIQSLRELFFSYYRAVLSVSVCAHRFVIARTKRVLTIRKQPSFVPGPRIFYCDS